MFKKAGFVSKLLRKVLNGVVRKLCVTSVSSRGCPAGMSRQTALISAASRIDAEIARVQNEIKALDRSILAQQQQRSTLSANLDSLLAAKEKSDMLAPTHSAHFPVYCFIATCACICAVYF